MAILQGQEALDYIKKNGNKGYTVLDDGTGRAGQSVKPKFGFIEGLLHSFADPFINSALNVGEGANALTQGLQNGSFSGYTPKYMNQAEYKRIKDNPWKIGQDFLGAGVNTLSLVPGFQGVKGAALIGGLGGLSQGDSLQEALTSGVLGAATGGLAGKLLGPSGLGSKLATKKLAEGQVAKQGITGKLGNKLLNFADNQESAALQRNMGYKVPMKLGGQKLVPEIKRLGLEVADPDSLVASAENILNQKRGLISNITNDLSQQGATVNINDVIKPLQQQLAKTNSPTLKKPLQDVIEEMTMMGGETGQISLSQFYKIKQEVGKLSKFNPFADPAQASKANAYQKIYSQSNKLMDNSLKQYGFNDFQTINKDITSALRARNYGELASGRAMNSRPANLLDLVTAGSGAVAGGPAGMAVGVLGSKVIQSPKTEQLIANTARKLGGKLAGVEGTTKTPGILSKLLSNPVTPYASAPIARMASQAGLGMNNTTPNTGDESMNMNPMDIESLGLGELMQPNISQIRGSLAQELMGMTDAKGNAIYSPTEALKEADALMEIQGYSTPNKQGKTTDQQRKYMSAANLANQALGLLESGQAKTGKIATVTNSIGRFFGSQNESQTDYLSKIASARGIAISALSGANVPPQEYARIRSMIPEDTDEPKIAKQKLRSFVQAMQIYADSGGAGSQESEMQNILSQYMMGNI
jgi:hypothetical protein